MLTEEDCDNICVQTRPPLPDVACRFLTYEGGFQLYNAYQLLLGNDGMHYQMVR
jgi:hypothetical protein